MGALSTENAAKRAVLQIPEHCRYTDGSMDPARPARISGDGVEIGWKFEGYFAAAPARPARISGDGLEIGWKFEGCFPAAPAQPARISGDGLEIGWKFEGYFPAAENAAKRAVLQIPEHCRYTDGSTEHGKRGKTNSLAESGAL